MTPELVIAARETGPRGLAQDSSTGEADIIGYVATAAFPTVFPVNQNERRGTAAASMGCGPTDTAYYAEVIYPQVPHPASTDYVGGQEGDVPRTEWHPTVYTNFNLQVDQEYPYQELFEDKVHAYLDDPIKPYDVSLRNRVATRTLGKLFRTFRSTGFSSKLTCHERRFPQRAGSCKGPKIWRKLGQLPGTTAIGPRPKRTFRVGSHMFGIFPSHSSRAARTSRGGCTWQRL
jgi:hypothetical protein